MWGAAGGWQQPGEPPAMSLPAMGKHQALSHAASHQTPKIEGKKKNTHQFYGHVFMFCSHKPSWVSVLTAYTTRKKASLSSLHPCFQNNQKKEKKTYYFQIWKALCTLQLTIFMESCEMRERFIPKSASMLDSASSKQLAAFIHQGWKSVCSHLGPERATTVPRLTNPALQQQSAQNAAEFRSIFIWSYPTSRLEKSFPTKCQQTVCTDTSLLSGYTVWFVLFLLLG